MTTHQDSAELRTARIERQLATAQQITHIGSWEWELATNVVTWSDELYRIYGLEPQSVEITFEGFLSRVHPDDRAHTQSEVGKALERGGRFSYPERIIRPDGSVRELETVGEVATDNDGKLVGLIGCCRDVTDDRKRDETIRLAQRNEAEDLKILEHIVSNPSLDSVLEAIARSVEHRLPDTHAAIHVFEADKPASVREGGCPTPITAKDGRVLGTLVINCEVESVTAEESARVIARAVHLAGIAIERQQLEEQLRALSAHVEEVREEERTGIAREVHDELGQALTALKMDVAWIARRLILPELREKTVTMSAMIDETIQVVRRISAELRPGVLDDIGLRAAVEWQSQELERRIGVRCTVTSNLGDEKLDRSISTAVFRIFQEALTNIARHAQASRVDVLLQREGEHLLLDVVDDGRGITPEQASKKTALGLLGIRERARRLGGEASIAPASPKGTRVSLRIPLVVK